MNNLKAIVKVMNFHSLLHVDKSRQQAKKYNDMADTLNIIIENIMYNRNIMLDYKTLRTDPKKPKLNIYIGTDMGFCANINSLVKGVLNTNKDNGDDTILIGKKLLAGNTEEPLLYISREDYNADDSSVMKLIEDGIKNMKYSAITITYNKYINASKVELAHQTIFPMEKREDPPVYKEDFTIEGDPDTLLVDLVVLASKYQMMIAAAGSNAAENINRQNVTTESLKKIDERDELELQQQRREKREEQFKNVLEDFIHKM